MHYHGISLGLIAKQRCLANKPDMRPWVNNSTPIKICSSHVGDIGTIDNNLSSVIYENIQGKGGNTGDRTQGLR